MQKKELQEMLGFSAVVIDEARIIEAWNLETDQTEEPPFKLEGLESETAYKLTFDTLDYILFYQTQEIKEDPYEEHEDFHRILERVSVQAKDKNATKQIKNGLYVVLVRTPDYDCLGFLYTGGGMRGQNIRTITEDTTKHSALFSIGRKRPMPCYIE